MILRMINADRYCSLKRYPCSLFHINLQRGATLFVVEASSRQSPAYVFFFLAVTSQQCAPLSIAAERTTLISDRDVDFLSLSAKGSDLTSPLFTLTQCSSVPIPMTTVVPAHSSTHRLLYFHYCEVSHQHTNFLL